MNMQFNEERLKGYRPYQLFPEDLGAGLPETAADAEVASWPAVPAMIGPQGAVVRPVATNAAKPTLDVNDIFPGLPSSSPPPMDPQEAMRQLRMERARQAYERRFGMHNPAGASLASQGSQEGVDYLLERIKRARADGTYKTGNYKRRA
jgi:hypothetical protein